MNRIFAAGYYAVAAFVYLLLSLLIFDKMPSNDACPLAILLFLGIFVWVPIVINNILEGKK